METCKHGSQAPVEVLSNLHECQAGYGRHKCCVCAYARGREWKQSHPQTPITGPEVCNGGKNAQPEVLSALPDSQAGAGRHACAICAYHAGFDSI